ncbi:MAG: undecaprenyl/decaprenyl-phosphate alpha-N-acetylglucosaminyl 1-phosphate transferase [Armatimonadetes bacterium]|nr:undecaprenyl/decaprenyl-phosphate alpha-N-acetylglucosaminyl 1-phosphate transferase [Armatimonadota bacterium]
MTPLLIAFLGGLAGCLAAHGFALRRGLVHHPKSERWNGGSEQEEPLAPESSVMVSQAVQSPKRQITTLGGVGIWTGVAAALLVACPQDGHRNGAILIGATIALIFGLWDDRRNLSPRTKLLVQAFLGVYVATLAVDINYLPSLLKIPMVTFAVIAGMNMVNLMDNMDGAAGLLSGLAGAGLSILGWQGENLQMLSLGMSLVGASAAFWGFNHPPARMYMGDAGSMLIGYLLTVLALQASTLPYIHSWQKVMVPPLILGLFIMDTLGVMIWRRMNGRPIMQGDCNHLTHRLAKLVKRWAKGGSEGWVNALLGILQIILVLVVLMAVRSGSPFEATAWLGFAVAGLAALGLGVFRWIQ